MADPKYANLPGIAYDQPDIYETTDLPEADQKSDFFEDEKDPIERLHISATEAFNKFKDKALDGRAVDFSDRITRRVRTGYDARSGEWELVAEGEKETPLQKYQRLQCEMKELYEEVSKLQEGDKKNDSENCLVTSEQVGNVLKQLYDLKLEDSIGAGISGNLNDPQGNQIKKLFSHMEQFKQNAAPSKSAKDKKEASSSTDPIVYQLEYRPEHLKLEQTTRLSELEHRLHKLESIIGATSEKLTRLATDTQENTLYDVTQKLSATASLLDSAQLDHIEGRLTALQQKMNLISTQNAASPEDAEKDKKIIELYDFVRNCIADSQLLHETLDRLVTLEPVHNKASEFCKTLAQIDALQSQLMAEIHNNKALLQGVQESFASNFESINKNFTSIDNKIKSIKK